MSGITEGVKAVKQERRELVRRLRQADAILAGFAGLNGKPKDEAPKPVRAKKARKPRAKKAEVPEGDFVG